jgi:hypothetical protein
MTGADVFVLFVMAGAPFGYGGVIYLLADWSARRGAARKKELRKQAAEQAGEFYEHMTLKELLDRLPERDLRGTNQLSPHTSAAPLAGQGEPPIIAA